MLIVMRHGTPQEDIDRVVEVIEEMGYQARPMPGRQRTTVGLVGQRRPGGRVPARGASRACRRSSTSPSRTSRSRGNGRPSPRSSGCREG